VIAVAKVGIKAKLSDLSFYLEGILL